MSFSKNLVRLRRAKGLSQENLADELDLSRQSISKWELEVTKPDTENLIKLSKLFGIKIDDLIGNEVIDTEALSINVKEDTKKIKMLKIWRGVVISGLILFIIIVIYKFVMLFRITEVKELYNEVNNYHYEISTYVDMDTVEKEECWFKDGVSKTIYTVYENNNPQTVTTCINYNEKNGYIINGEKDVKENINVDEYLLFHEDYQKGKQLYDKIPELLKDRNILHIIGRSLNNLDTTIKQNIDNIQICTNDEYISLERNTLLPKIKYYKEANIFKTKQYKIELNSVKSIKI